MRHPIITVTALASLLAGGALAQTQPNVTGPTSAAPLPTQQQKARQIDAAPGTRATSDLLRQADAAVAKKDWGSANEYVERAKTAWLNRELLAGPQSQNTDTAFGPAQAAIRARDAAAAHRGIQSAMALAGQDDSSMRSGTGVGAGTVPAQGGGAGLTGSR